MLTGVIVVREESEFLYRNILHHLSLGFDRFFILLHISDKTVENKLSSLFGSSVSIYRSSTTEFHQRELQQYLLSELLKEPQEDEWIFPLDADEFVWVDENLKSLLNKLEASRVTYGCMKLFDMLHDLDNQTYYEDPFDAIYGFFPFKERSWEQPSSFYKSFCKKHQGMTIFQGGHSFTSVPHLPHALHTERAKIFHYTNKGKPATLLRKWKNLSSSRLGQELTPKPVWWEKYELMHERVQRYENNLQLLVDEWFRLPKTFWGTSIPHDLIIRDDRMRHTLKSFGELP